MANFLISCIGKQKSGPEKELLDVYQTRLRGALEVREFETKPSLDLKSRKAFEADLLLSPFTNQDFIIALDERGKAMTSSEIAGLIDQAQNDSYKRIGFIIGGADGLCESVRKKANRTLSLGAMTWPHMLVRALIAEQIYRGMCILSNHPYHRE